MLLLRLRLRLLTRVPRAIHHLRLLPETHIKRRITSILALGRIVHEIVVMLLILLLLLLLMMRRLHLVHHVRRIRHAAGTSISVRTLLLRKVYRL